MKKVACSSQNGRSESAEAFVEGALAKSGESSGSHESRVGLARIETRLH
jgi:hypothetical protein